MTQLNEAIEALRICREALVNIMPDADEIYADDEQGSKITLAELDNIIREGN
jgi:hypothetical protein